MLELNKAECEEEIVSLTIQKNRHYLKILYDCVLYLCYQNLAMRGSAVETRIFSELRISKK